MKKYQLNGRIFSSIHRRLDFEPYICYEGEIEIKLRKVELIALGATPIEDKEEHNWEINLCGGTQCTKCGVSQTMPYSGPCQQKEDKCEAEKDFGDKSRLRFDYQDVDKVVDNVDKPKKIEELHVSTWDSDWGEKAVNKINEIINALNGRDDA